MTPITIPSRGAEGQGRSLPDPEVYVYARREASRDSAGLNPWTFAQILIWPRAIANVPTAFREYAERWVEFMALPAGLAPPTAAAVLHVITSAMSRDPSDDRFNAFLSYGTIATRAHTHRKTVQRVIAWQKVCQLPLISCALTRETKGIHHRCFRFSLILDPFEFTHARDATRLEKVTVARANYKELQPLLLAAQKAVIASPDTPASRARFEGAISELVEHARGNLPRDVLRAELLPSGSLRSRR